METKTKLTTRQQDAFTRRPDEDAAVFIARGYRTLRFRDLPALLLLRNKDRKQVEAMQLYADLKMAQWTRALVFSTLFLGVCTIAAALIVVAD
jgi:hypothetical protein